MTTHNFNFQDFHEFLLESTANIDNNRKTEEYGSLWGNTLCANSIEGSSMKESSLSTFVGDITPAAAAVVAADESPEPTPLLDYSCMNTPVTPATVLTPSRAQFQNSFYCSPYMGSSANQGLSVIDPYHNDIQIANYLKPDLPWEGHATDLFAQPPAITSTDIAPELLNSIKTISVDPTQLTLDSNTVDNTVAAPSSVDASNGPLFAPISSQNTSYSLNSNTQLDESFDSHNFDTINLFDEYFEDLFDLTVEPSIMQPRPAPTPVITKRVEPVPIVVSKKRKADDNKTNKTIKRVKVAPSTSAVVKTQDERKFECDICHAFFNRRFNLNTHIKTHDKNREKDFACHLCTKSFDRKHDLSRHVGTVHNGERPYGCNECTSTFSRNDALLRHRLQKHNYGP